MSFRWAVRAKTWKSQAHKFTAGRFARALDVMKKSGMDLDREPVAEVLRRDLLATWYEDQHGEKHKLTADLMRESSDATEGMPRSTMMEAMAYRKILRGAGSD